MDRLDFYAQSGQWPRLLQGPELRHFGSISAEASSAGMRTFKDWKAIPTHSPLLLKAGPPLLPELMAASIWTPRSSAAPCT